MSCFLNGLCRELQGKHTAGGLSVRTTLVFAASNLAGQISARVNYLSRSNC